MEKEKTVDFESFAETDFEINSKSSVQQDNRLRGLAELKSCQVSEFTEEIDGSVFEQKYVIFEAVVHGDESALVYVKENSELYDFMLRFTTSENISTLAGQYIPVDRIEPGIYQPSRSLATTVQKEFPSIDVFEDLQSFKRSIECGFIEYNTDTHNWELVYKSGCEFIYDEKLFSASASLIPALIVSSLITLYLNTLTFILPLLLVFSLIFTGVIYKGINYWLDYTIDRKIPL